MRTVGNFNTDDPDRLARQLSDLEDNAQHESDSIRKTFAKLPVKTPVVNSGGGFYTVGQAIDCNTGGGAFTINLTVPADKLPGIAFILNRTATLVTVVPVPPAKIDTGVSNTFAGGLFMLFFDGVDWWSP